MNTFRKLLLDQLDTRSYGKYDFSWNVKTYNVPYSAAELLQKYRCEYPDLELIFDAETDWYGRVNDATDLARAGITDDYGYSSLSLDACVKYGIPYANKRVYKRRTDEMAYYPAGKEGWVLVKPYKDNSFDPTLEFQGRRGGHLVLTHLNRVEMQDLEYKITEGEVANEWCQLALAVIHDYDQIFTPDNACQEVERQLLCDLENEYEMTLHEWSTE